MRRSRVATNLAGVLLLAVALLVPAADSQAQAANGVPIAGDANCDGTTDSLDALTILQHDAGLVPSVPCPVEGDVTGDGMNNAIDAILILQFSAGLFPHFV